MLDENKLSEILAIDGGEDYVYEHLYPFPLADLYRRYRVSRDPVNRLAYLFAASEASIKLLSALALAQGKWEPEAKIHFKQLKLSAPEFETWKKLLEILIPTGNSLSPLEKSLYNCIRDSSGEMGQYLRSITTIIEYRNDYIRSMLRGGRTAESILEETTLAFKRAFRELDFLAYNYFVISQDVQRLRKPPCFEAVIRICQGCNPVFPYELWRLHEPLDPQVPYLIDSEMKTAYSLHPLIAVFSDDRLDLPQSFFYSYRKSNAYWQTYAYHQDNARIGSPDLEEEIEFILNGELKSVRFLLNFYSNNHPHRLTSLFKIPEKSILPVGYKMLGQIGEGRYGVVYQVFHEGLQEVRAFKLLRPELSQDPRIRKRFDIEAQSLSKLRNKNVAIDLYEYSETSTGVPYLLMQFIEKGSLKEAVERWGAKPWVAVLEIGIACFRALGIIHEAGILHRDIKLSNILVVEEDFLFCDFGVGKLIDIEQSLTIEGDAIGTELYMAPEQRSGEADARSDLFSLGVCLIHILAGRAIKEPRKWLYDEYDGNEDFRNALLGIIETIPENRPPSAVAIEERLIRIKKDLATDTRHDKANAAITYGALQSVPKKQTTHQRIWRSPDGTIFREIPAGEFLMGGTKYPDERPVHNVKFSQSFYMATTAVTNKQFKEFRGATRYNGKHTNFLLHLRRDFFQGRWKHPNSPVVFVSWNDAKEYLLWRCEKDDLDYRLPTEAQWEYACRAGTRTVYYWGNLYDPKFLNTAERHGGPTPVGTYAPNPWGLFDMLGNIWEWCEDFFDVIPQEESVFFRHCAELADGTCVDPVNIKPHLLLSRRVGPNLRAGRGGSWFSENHNCRPANRRGQHQDSCVRSFGFRLVAYNVPEDEIEELT